MYLEKTPRLILNVAVSVTTAPLVALGTAKTLNVVKNNPTEALNTINDIVNPSMPPSTKYGTSLNLLREIKSLLDY